MKNISVYVVTMAVYFRDTLVTKADTLSFLDAQKAWDYLKRTYNYDLMAYSNSVTASYLDCGFESTAEIRLRDGRIYSWTLSRTILTD